MTGENCFDFGFASDEFYDLHRYFISVLLTETVGRIAAYRFIRSPAQICHDCGISVLLEAEIFLMIYRNVHTEHYWYILFTLFTQQKKLLVCKIIIHDGVTLFSIPITNSKTEMTTAVLEALAAESYRTVTPMYYEMALKVKYTRDELSGIMIDLVRDGVVNDFAIDFGNAVKVNDNGICFWLRNIIWSKSSAVTSSLESYEDAFQASLDSLLENMEKYAG